MDTRKLRQKILDLAIRGKLVPQDPNDEPASVLLERIKAEKEQLIKEGKIKRPKKTSSSDKSHYENIPFEIPEGWVWCNGNQIFLPMNSIKPSGDMFKYIDIDAIDNKNHKLITPKLIKTKEAPSRASRHTKKGDVLFSMVRPYLENIALIEENDCIASTGFFICSPSQILTSEYCYYMMLSEYVISGLNQFMKGDNSPSINNIHITSWLYPIPPIKEQNRISKEIKKWFDFINSIEQEKTELNTFISQTKSKILDLAISGKLVPQDPTDEPAINLLKRINPNFEPCDNSHYENIPFKIPQNWCWIKLNTVCNIARGGSPRPIKDYLTTSEDGINWIKIGDTDKDGKYINSTKEKIIPDGVRKSRMVHKGDFLLTNSMSFGRPYILNVDGCIHDGWLVISPMKDTYDTEFLYYLLSSRFAYDQFTEIASGGVVSNLNSDKVANSYFPILSISEQKRIADKITQIWSMIDTITAEL